MDYLTEKVKDVLIKQNHSRYLVYKENAIIETSSEKKLMKILLHNFTPSVYDDFWMLLIQQNGLINEFTEALRQSYHDTPRLKGEIVFRGFPSQTDRIWNFLKDNESQLMMRVGDFFDQMVDNERIVLKNFPNEVVEFSGNGFVRIEIFKKMSDLNIVREIAQSKIIGKEAEYFEIGM